MPLLDLTGTFGLRVAGCDVSEVRIAGMGGRWERRVNLATNPSFESTSGTVVVRTNLCTTPASYTPAADGPYPGLTVGSPYTASAEIGGVRQAVDPLALVGGVTYERLLIEAGAVPLGPYFDGSTKPALRRNLARKLCPAAPSAASFGTGGTGVGGLVSDPEGDYAWMTWEVPGTGNARHQSVSTDATLVAGKTYTIALDLRGNAARMGVSIDQNVNGAWVSGISAAVGNYALSGPTDEWLRVHYTFVLKEGTNGIAAFARPPATDIVPGTTIMARNFDIYEGPFDPTREFVPPGQRDSTGLLCEWSGPVNASPSVVVDPDFTPAWTGPVGASTSVLRGVLAAPYAGGVNFARVSSSRWRGTGERSLRIVPLGTVSDTYAQVAGATASGAEPPAGMPPLHPGHTYRVSAVCHLVAPQTGGVTNAARGIQVFRGTWSGTEPRTQAPNTAGEHPLTLVFTVPADAPWATLRLYNGASAGNGDVWWDDLVIEEISDATPTHDEPFHGDTPDTPDALYRWQDAPHGSPSTAYYAWQPV